MKGKTHSTEEIIRILRQADGGGSGGLYRRADGGGYMGRVGVTGAKRSETAVRAVPFYCGAICIFYCTRTLHNPFRLLLDHVEPFIELFEGEDGTAGNHRSGKGEGGQRY